MQRFLMYLLMRHATSVLRKGALFIRVRQPLTTLTPTLPSFPPIRRRAVPFGSRQHEKVDSDICPALKRQSIRAEGMDGRGRATPLSSLPPSLPPSR